MTTTTSTAEATGVEVRRPSFAEMCAAKEEIRSFDHLRCQRALTGKELARRAALDEVVAAHFAPETAEEAPTLDDLRAEYDALEASIAERKRAEAATHRDRALSDWESRRQGFRDELERRLNSLAGGLVGQSPTDPVGLADLYEVVSDRFDKEMRKRIPVLAEASERHAQARHHEVKRLQELQRDIRELEPLPNPYEARRDRNERVAAERAATTTKED